MMLRRAQKIKISTPEVLLPGNEYVITIVTERPLTSREVEKLVRELEMRGLKIVRVYTRNSTTRLIVKPVRKIYAMSIIDVIPGILVGAGILLISIAILYAAITHPRTFLITIAVLVGCLLAYYVYSRERERKQTHAMVTSS